MKYNPIPSRSLLIKFYYYNPITGHFFNKSTGRRIGRSLSGGYGLVSRNGVLYKTSRLIWRMMTGNDPGNMDVDHADRDESNDKWDNLRLATRSQNLINRKIMPSNKTGYTGIDVHKGRYRLRLSRNGKRHKFGFFDTLEAAVKKRDEILQEWSDKFRVS